MNGPSQMLSVRLRPRTAVRLHVFARNAGYKNTSDLVRNMVAGVLKDQRPGRPRIPKKSRRK